MPSFYASLDLLVLPSYREGLGYSVLEAAVTGYLLDPDLRRRHGLAGRERVLSEFCPESIWEAQLEEYHLLLGEAGLGASR